MQFCRQTNGHSISVRIIPANLLNDESCMTCACSAFHRIADGGPHIRMNLWIQGRGVK